MLYFSVMMSPAGRPRTPRRGSRVAGLLLFGVLVGACAIPRWPVEGPVISPFGLRFRGFAPDFHEGVDVFAPAGTPVRAMKPGLVARAGRFRGLGLAVYLDHGRGLMTIYGHLSSLAVAQGDTVEHRQVIGEVGQTGNATSPHLHFEVLRNGRAVDPVPLLGGRP
ncbi:MAG TPA: M23 family metallopeptidase [Longimicrobiales bacterium]|nr:M23 family metallopeptidase [Longimicrobiales bacterium]